MSEVSQEQGKQWFTHESLFLSCGQWTFTTAWSHIPIFKNFDSCYDVDEVLEEGKVLTPTITVDSESAQSFYHFKTRKAGESFVKRLNKFIDKKSAQVNKLKPFMSRWS